MGILFSRPKQPAPPPDADDERPAKRRRMRASKKYEDVEVEATVEVETEVNEEVNAEAKAEATEEPKALRRPKRKFALFLAYVGEKYSGMQINPNVVTIEQTVLDGLVSAGLVTPQNGKSLMTVNWMRAARTDKGVSAAGNCASVKLMIPEEGFEKATETLNTHLPPDICVLGIQRATNGFNGRSDCQYRRYEYILPLALLGKAMPLGHKGPDLRTTNFTAVLSAYEGSHIFANFTEGVDHGSDQARRVMKSVRCFEVVTPPGSSVPFVVIEILGQSFLLHQIRKMIGLALAVYHGHVPRETIAVALQAPVRVATPMAPALGLLLDSLYFDQYNSRYKRQLGGPISDQPFADQKRLFKIQHIYRNIASREWRFRTIENWVTALGQRSHVSPAQIRELHAKFVTSSVGKDEMRIAKQASYYKIYTCIEDFAGGENTEIAQQASIVRDAYVRAHRKEPSFIARAPGRVILIGEHLDYNGLPVIGVALKQNVMVAGEPLVSVPHIDVSHVEDVFPSAMLLSRTGEVLPPDGPGRDAGEGNTLDPLSPDTQWLRYVSGGTKALLKKLDKKRPVSGGGRLLFGGDLARAGGLASSSALVSAATLGAARLNRKRFPRTELAQAAADGERGGVGTQGGCVDHVVNMCATEGTATMVSFVPRLDVSNLRLPKRLRLFVVDSGVVAHKGSADGVRDAFNYRAAECRVGAALLASRLGLPVPKTIATPGQLLFQVRKNDDSPVSNAADLRREAKQVMEDDLEISPDMARIQLDMSPEEFCNRFLKDRGAARRSAKLETGEEKEWVEGPPLAVGKRMAHVLSEAARVDEMAALLGDNTVGDEKKVERIGEILSDGQRSLQEWLETSCEAVDDTVIACIAAGATGARMTGAGWGGFVVCSVLDENADQFFKDIRETVGPQRAVLPVEPGDGACIFAIHQAYGAPRSSDSKPAAGTKTAAEHVTSGSGGASAAGPAPVAAAESGPHVSTGPGAEGLRGCIVQNGERARGQAEYDGTPSTSGPPR